MLSTTTTRSVFGLMLLAGLWAAPTAWAQGEQAAPEEAAEPEATEQETGESEPAEPETGEPEAADEAAEAEAARESEAAEEPERDERAPEQAVAQPAGQQVEQVEAQRVPAPPSAPPAAGPSDDALEAVVGVQSVGEHATGVLLGSGQYVVTSYGVTRRGRPVQVRLSDGTSIEGETVAVDRGSRVSVVRLAREVRSVEPRTLRPRPARGAWVWLVQPVWIRGSGLEWSAVRAEVTSGQDGPLLIAASIEPEQGAAVLDADGGLVGIARGQSGWGDGGMLRVTEAGAVESLLDTVGPDTEAYSGGSHPIFRFGWSGEMAFGGDAVVDGDDSMLLHGPTLTLGWVFNDRWLVQLDGNFLVFDTADDNRVLRTNVRAFQGQLLLGYRALLTSASSHVPVYLSPQIGGIVDWVQVERRELTVDAVEGLDVVKAEDEEVYIRPVVRLAFTMFRHLELAASAQIDTQDLERTRLGLFVGFGY